jgi:hypothetical protein
MCPRPYLSHWGGPPSQEIHNVRTGTTPYDKPELKSGEGYSGCVGEDGRGEAAAQGGGGEGGATRVVAQTVVAHHGA